MSLNTTPFLQIKKLRLENFRSYSRIDQHFDSQMVIITGPNGSGKTTILEAIGLLSNLRSFRNGSDKDLLKKGEPFYTIEGEFGSTKGLEKLFCSFGSSENEKASRRMKVNGKAVERVSGFIGKFATVVFSPDDIAIIDSGPAERRRFIDMVLSMVSTGYLNALQQYKKSLTQRGAILHRSGAKTDPILLRSIDRELSVYGATIQKEREGFLKQFTPMFKKYVNEISGGKDQWEIIYQPSIPDGSMKEGYFAGLERGRANDLRLRQTTRGVHRDRVGFYSSDNNELSSFASQGQKRTVVLSMKLAQYEYTRSITDSSPIMLIDDVLNELDVERRKLFIRYLNQSGQTFITTTDIKALEGFIREKMEQIAVSVFELSGNENGAEFIPVSL